MQAGFSHLRRGKRYVVIFIQYCFAQYCFERTLYTIHSVNRDKDYNLTFHFFDTLFYST